MRYSVNYNTNTGVRKFSFDETSTRFLTDYKSYMNLIGPVGSGKDLTCYMKLFEYADIFDKSRFLIIKDDGYKQFKQYFGDLSCLTFMNEIIGKTYVLLEDGNKKAEFIFIDSNNITEEDAIKIVTMELTGAFIETHGKSQEYIHSILMNISNRIGRFPSKELDSHREVKFEKHPKFIITNGYNPLILPYLNITFENYYQPNGTSPNAENLTNLPRNYYQDIVKNMPEEYVNLFVKTDKKDLTSM